MSENLQVVTFSIKDRTYGLDIKMVKEVNPNTSITPVPLGSRDIRGLVNIRGQVVLVLDMAVILGWEPGEIEKDSRIIILKTAAELSALAEHLEEADDRDILGDKPLAFLVDSIGDVVTVDISEIEPVPHHLRERSTELFRGVIKLKDRLLMILTPTKVIQHSEEFF